ncbi:MAG: 1-acyl-sn-glycerol-3-phosphate acyltransferase [Pseudomonadales bacterium]|uniref:1-acyl-sn-glycerol-3-phosphate acyltransferase n=1 Tax=Alcanivorax sp. MD8A TaxID=1177157 RepID=UPI000C9A89E8|nr:1-acyl-sn-glycerol-3-phosphate acyltransferase [Alcanivorax sp. MD8A]MCG8438856.1 1-acyl-sn-glycerol-3-phosphate acyltransferase [Pseudomonadales bacterium]MED5431379.1 1-acyl-sn-glycerol-3-phosphate acyltransferase [Pseudomonadota bacterium]MEE2870564.1 1-acyl-sn-glycerol-3-phosphate acyltransferase [Pseudomonadota bacterium]PNE02162.1 acyltransferase [Alcanivorax sp. MD8A]
MKQELPAVTQGVLGGQIPRRGHWLLVALGKLILRLMGWRIVGKLPNVDRAVLAVAPHTSNIDGLIGLSAIQSLRVYVRFMGKHTLFEGRFGKLMYWLGGIPVNRDSAKDLVEQTAAAMRQAPCWLGIAPEGTRKGAERWKTGFYRIAEALDVPIVVLGFCYRRKQVRIVGMVHPSGDVEKDLATMVAMLSDIVPRHPERLSEPFKGRSPLA